MMAKILEKAKGNFSLISLGFILLLFSIIFIVKKRDNILSWDVFGYYLHTPAFSLWDDSSLKDFSKVEAINAKYENTGTFYQGSKTENGSWMIKYTMGLAILESPFFIVAHKLAPALGYEPDGFSIPYQNAMYLCTFFYLVLGLIILRKALKKIFTDNITAILLTLLVFGTNFLIAGMLGYASTPIHVLAFTLFSIVLYLTILWHESPSRKIAVLLGLTIGFVVLLRPSDIPVVLIPILWGVKSRKELSQKFLRIIKQHKLDFLLLAVVSFIVLFPQLYYWKTTTGSWFMYSYNNNPGEGFEFASPYIFDVLFSFRKGWLLYTPIMLFSIIGFYYMYKQKKELFLPLFLFFIINVYIISSWSCWWYAGSFSQRAMVDSYAIMLLPLGYFILAIKDAHAKKIKNTFLIIFLALIILNLFQSWQYENKILHSSRMTAAYYLKIFGKTSIDTEAEKLLLINNDEEKFLDEKEYTSRIVLLENYEIPIKEIAPQIMDSIGDRVDNCLRVDSNFIFTPKFEASYKELTRENHAWIRTSFSCLHTSDVEAGSLSLVVTFLNFEDKLYKYRAIDLPSNKYLTTANKWNEISYDYLTPEVRSKEDKINIYLWYRGKQPIYIDNFKIEVFEKQINNN